MKSSQNQPQTVAQMKPVLDKLRYQLHQAYGEQVQPLIDSVVSTVAPQLINEGRPYAAIIDSLCVCINNNLSLAQDLPAPLHDPPSQGRLETESKRSPPINPKQKVADEWAAVMLHQAEIESKIQDDQKRIYREQQKRYKEELDRQSLEAASRTKKMGQKSSEGVGLILGREDREKEQAERKKAATKELQRELEEHQRTIESERNRELEEKAEYEQYLKQIDESETRRKNDELERKLRMATALRSSYAQQEQLKKQQLLTQRETDRLLLQQCNLKWPFVDCERKKRWESIDRANKADQHKAAVYENLVKDVALKNMRFQEEIQEKMRQDKEKKERESEIMCKERHTKEKEIAKMILNHQLMEKQEKQKQKQRMEEEFRAGIQTKISDMEQKEKERLESEYSKRQSYKEYLKKQIEEDERRKKLAGNQMTEYERKMNNKDIEAYTNNLTEIHSKIVGLRSSPIGPQQKYIARRYGIKPTDYGKGSYSGTLQLGGYMALDKKLDENPILGNSKRMSLPPPIEPLVPETRPADS